MKQDPYPTAASPIHSAVVKLFYSRAARQLFTNAWYSLLSNLDRDAAIRFLNYGYASLNGEQVALQAADEPDRYAIQLYHHVASGSAIEGKDVLEVGSGRGGGASYIARYLHPKSYTGLDICKPAIRFSKARYADQDNLAFRVGNALSLPFADESFDVVVNVESAQHYGDMGRFLDEVHRVLRPGGAFLMACFEDRSKDVYPREALAQSRLRLVRRGRHHRQCGARAGARRRAANGAGGRDRAAPAARRLARIRRHSGHAAACVLRRRHLPLLLLHLPQGLKRPLRAS